MKANTMTNISELTKDCLSQISSLTSPKDVLELSASLKQLVSASESDAVWEKFLPPNCDDIISRSSTWIPRDQVASKKNLFHCLSRFPILLDNMTKSFTLNETSGKISYMLGSRALSVTWGTNSEYWNWKSIPESRFPECAVLKNVCWLEIQGKIRTTLLSPGITYGAYFVFKINVDSFGTGFSQVPVNVSVSVIGKDGLPIDSHHVVETKSFYLQAPRSDEERRQSSPGELPVVREDGWMEIEMGMYQVGVNDSRRKRVELEMSLKEVEIGHWKSGLVVHGIEIRPLS